MTIKFKSLSFSILLLLSSCKQEGDKSASVAKPSSGGGNTAPAACPAGQMRVSGVCVLSNQTRSCVSQPAHSTGGTEASTDGGQTWGSCINFTCNYKYYFDPFLGGGTCTKDNFIATYTNNNPLSSCDGVQTVVQTLDSCIGQNTSVSDNSECAATSNVSMWSPSGTKDVAITGGTRHDTCSFGSSIPYSKNITCDLNYFADNYSLSCIEGLYIYYRADSISATNGQSICLWDDSLNPYRKLNGYPSCPIYISNAQGGKPALSFDGVSNYLTNSLPMDHTNEETIIVIYKDESNPSSVLLNHSSTYDGNVVVRLNNSANNISFEGKDDYWSFQSPLLNIDDSSTSILSIRQKLNVSVNLRFNQNNIWSRSLYSTENLPNDVFYVGTFDDLSGFFKGQIFEIIIFRRKLSDSEISSVENFLKSKYSLP